MSDYFVCVFDPQSPDQWTCAAVCEEQVVAEHLARIARERDDLGALLVDARVVSERALLRSDGARGVERARDEALKSPLVAKALRAQAELPLLAVERAWQHSERAKQRVRMAIREALDANFTLHEVADFARISHEQVRRLAGTHLIASISDARKEAAAYLRDRSVFAHGYVNIDEAMPGGGARRNQMAMILHKADGGGDHFALQALVRMARAGRRCVIVSHGFSREALLVRIVQMHLGASREQAQRVIEADAAWGGSALLSNIAIIDPFVGSPDMTVEDLHARIDEVVDTQFDGEPLDVLLLIESLGHLHIDPRRAPQSVIASDKEAQPYLMRQLFVLTRALKCYTMVVALTPKSVPAGAEFVYDAGRGGSKDVDHCDAVFTVWMPEQEAGVREEDRLARFGQLRVHLAKHRHGPQATEYLFLDRLTGRLLPSEQWQQSDDSQLQLPEDDEGDDEGGDAA